MSKMRRYVLTLNNPDSVPLNTSEIPKDVRYFCHQLESGENGTLHLQGYIELFKPQRLSWLKKWLPRGHFEVARGERHGVRAYAMKEGTRVEGPWEYGVWIDSDSGKPALRDSMKRAMNGDTLESIMIDDPESYSRHKGALKKARSIYHQKQFFDRYSELTLNSWQEYLFAKLQEEPSDRSVFWVYGSNGGEGKSTFAKHLAVRQSVILPLGVKLTIVS
ncbi:uncharacterized protein LOC131235627 [Magnolia sinica]|uniref:uncharacterized protein LOC131235627 n=1 Tax=Magnolia sinica TaxID=86752 RepID=UPI00265909A7|nr:uncharacterized protein LOC131235627 [Magnolia sinica]